MEKPMKLFIKAIKNISVFTILSGFILLASCTSSGPVIKSSGDITRKDINENNNTISKIYALQTGVTRVPFGQFFGGLDGWVGMNGIIKMATDKSHYMWVPVHSFLIIHPKEGAILFDAGLSVAQTKEGYYSGLVPFTEEENLVSKEQELLNQLQKLGYGANDIKHIIVSHLHEDHIGELESFPNATVHISKMAWEDRNRVISGLGPYDIPVYYKPTFNTVRKWSFFEYDSGSFYSFKKSTDLFGDGSIMVVPTPGHATGHSGAVLSFDDYKIYLAGDSIYTLRHLDPNSLSSFQFSETDFVTYKSTIKKISRLQKRLADLIIIPSHDPFDYTFKYLHSFLSDGVITTAERTQLKDYHNSLYDESGRLKPQAIPKYVSSSKIGELGKAVAEIQ